MLEIVNNNVPVVAYVIEEESYNYYAINKYSKKTEDNYYDLLRENIAIFPKYEINVLDREEEVKSYISKYIGNNPFCVRVDVARNLYVCKKN